MKSLTLIFATIFFAALVSCDSGQQKQTERTVLDTDTVGVETEYEVEKKVKEKTVTIDTVTEEETVTRETELDSAESNN